MPLASLGRHACHDGADEIRQTLRLFRVACRDVAADRVFRGALEGMGRLSRLRIVAAGSLQNEATGSRGIGRVAARGVFQHGSERRGHGPVRAQKLGKRDSAGVYVPVEGTLIEAAFVSEGRVEARRVDAQHLGDVGNADPLVAARVEEALGAGNRLLGIESTRAAAATRLFCSEQYKNTLTRGSGRLCSVRYK